ncbi:MAG: MarR family transcriptional regulator [Opitutus sp.]|nr:MarR family transcriptional regulator [Opitutus sp.]
MPHLLLKDLPPYECLIEAAKHYPSLDPSACEVFLHLLRTGDEAFLFSEQNLAEQGISPGRFGVLMALAKACPPGSDAPGPGLTPAELADNSRVTRATMTGLIDTLERDGFVRRAVDAEDRRMIRICFTPKARHFLQRMLPGHFRCMASVMSTLSESERQTLVRLLDKIYQRAAALNAGVSARSVKSA